MATTFPTTLDTFTNPLSTDTLNSGTVPHDVQHTHANDALLAIETLVGITNSVNTNSIQYKVNVLNNGSKTAGFVTNSLGSYTVLSSDYTIVQNTMAAIYTLPTPTLGRLLHIVNQFAGLVQSASANVVPLIGGGAVVDILPAIAGKFVDLQGDGTNWNIISAN